MQPAKDAETILRELLQSTEDGPAADIPIVHLNGSGVDNLTAPLERAYEVACELGDALRACNPNGRDYYTDPGRMTRAEALARRRALAVSVLLDCIEADIAAIQRQG